MVIASYDIGDGMRGLVGVVGPTRMDYAVRGGPAHLLCREFESICLKSGSCRLPRRNSHERETKEERPSGGAAAGRHRPGNGAGCGKGRRGETTFTVTREQMEQMEQLAKMVSDASDKYLRLAAEYDNYRKRTTKEKENVYADAKADTVKAFLGVLRQSGAWPCRSSPRATPIGRAWR